MKRWLSALNILAVLSGIIMAVALLYPWWSLQIQYVGLTYIYPYIIRGPATTIIGYRKTAQMPLLTGLVIGCIVLCFVGSLLRRWKGRIALGAAGVLALLAAWRFYERAGDIARRWGMAVQGHSIAKQAAFSPLEVSAKLEHGFYLILIGAALSLVASVLHEKIRLRLG